jgi:hypothetical protein
MPCRRTSAVTERYSTTGLVRPGYLRSFQGVSG